MGKHVDSKEFGLGFLVPCLPPEASVKYKKSGNRSGIPNLDPSLSLSSELQSSLIHA